MASTSSRAASREKPLAEAVRLLRRHYGAIRSSAPSKPFALLLWEYVAYLTDDADRAAAFKRLEKEVGTKPASIDSAPIALLESICRSGGAIAFKLRAQRMKLVATRVLRDFRGSLQSSIHRPYLEARKVMKTFPAIGSPGADKILLLTGAHAVLALDSNALRVLGRLGYGEERKSYEATCASAQAQASTELKPTLSSLQEASLLLRHHGQELCRRTAPQCGACPLETRCPFARLSETKKGAK